MSLAVAEPVPLAMQQARILVIDDEPLNVDVMGRILREAGYEHICGITDPREAVQRFAEFDPDLVMLDLRMPHVDGFTLLRHIRGQVPPGTYLPILVITADWTPEARHRALSCGASEFLTRPLDSSEIVLRVGNLLSTRLLQAQLLKQNQRLESAVEERTAELRTAHERLQREMKARLEAQEALRRHTDFVHLLEVITVAASQSAPVHQTFQVALEQICASTHWEVGHALKRSPQGTLVSTGLWHVKDAEKFAPFRQESETMTYTSGSGLPGRVLASAQPAWIVDLASDLNFRRGRQARELGLSSGFAIPVLIGRDVAAVLEFFSTGTIPPDSGMLDFMHQIGAQLGRVVERQRAEDALRSSEAKFRSFAQLGSDGIVLADGRGRIVSWNHGAQQIFGYTEEEALGSSVLRLIPERLRPIVEPETELPAQPGLVRLLGRTLEIEGLRKDGATFPMEVALDVWSTWDGTFCSSVVRDVSSRQQMEESLRQSEERLRHLLGATKVIPWTLDLERMRVTYVGPQVVALLGFSTAEWRSDGFWSRHLHPEDVDWVLRHCEEALERQTNIELEYRMVAADGRNVWLHTFVSTNPTEKKVLSGFLLDVTEQKEAEETLRRFAAVIEFSHEAVVGGTLDGTITSWNRGAERLCGYTQGEVLGRNISLLQAEGGEDAWQHTLALVARGEHQKSSDVIWRHKRGDALDVDITASPIRDGHGRVTGFCAIARDISERKQAEETLRRSHDRLEVIVTDRTAELREANDHLRTEIAERREVENALRGSEERLKTLISAVEEIIFEFDESGHYSNFWAGDQELIAQLNQEFAGRSFAEVFGESVGRTFQATVSRVLFTGRPETVEHTLNLAGGRRWFLSRIAALTDPQGVRRTVCLLARDITSRKQAEEDLRMAKTDAERANLAKTQFLSRMSHELRTPLNAILGFTQLLDQSRLSAEDQEGVGQILIAGHHLLGLINEVLDMARIEAGRLTLTVEPMSAEEVIGEALALVRPLAAGRGIAMPMAECELVVLADRQRLRQVLLNFFSNAIKYNRENGSVSLSCARQEGALRIAITDSGHGIPADRLQYLFKPFERIETHFASGEGVGLGLAISKRLIELMGGRVGVESLEGEGSTFWLTLPLADDGQSGSETRIELFEQPPPGSFGPCNVLYIEDNLSNLKLVERILARQKNIHVLAATHGQPGLELAVRHVPSLILLDLHLPDMPGTEVLARLRANPRTAGIPIIVTSADPMAINNPLLRGGVMQGFLAKPLDMEKFSLALQSVLRPARPDPAPAGASDEPRALP